jgi:hypothetical protein
LLDLGGLLILHLLVRVALRWLDLLVRVALRWLELLVLLSGLDHLVLLNGLRVHWLGSVGRLSVNWLCSIHGLSGVHWLGRSLGIHRLLSIRGLRRVNWLLNCNGLHWCSLRLTLSVRMTIAGLQALLVVLSHAHQEINAESTNERHSEDSFDDDNCIILVSKRELVPIEANTIDGDADEKCKVAVPVMQLKPRLW